MARYRLTESGLNPGEWHVEAIDTDGHVMTATFSGANAEERARRYLAWLAGPPESMREAIGSEMATPPTEATS